MASMESPLRPIKIKVVVLREEDVPQNKETNEVFMPSSGKLQEIERDPWLCREIFYIKSMSSKDIKEELKNAFPFLANTERFFCAKAKAKAKLDFCGNRRIWSGLDLCREIGWSRVLYIYCEESSSQDRSDSGFETSNIPQDTSRNRDSLLSITNTTGSQEPDEYKKNNDFEDSILNQAEWFQMNEDIKEAYSCYPGAEELNWPINPHELPLTQNNAEVEETNQVVAQEISHPQVEGDEPNHIVEQEQFVHTICPSSSRLEGGGDFHISLKEELPEHIQSGYANFGNEVVVLTKFNKLTLAGTIPAAQEPGVFIVRVVSDTNEFLGETIFKYEDMLNTVVFQAVQLGPDRFSKLFALMEKHVRNQRSSATQSSSAKQNSGIRLSSNYAEQALSPQLSWDEIKLASGERLEERNFNSYLKEEVLQQLSLDEIKLASGERLEKSLSRSKIGDSKDSTSLEEVTSVLKDKQQTEEQSGEEESESFEETLSENQAMSPSTIDKGKDSTSLEEVISVPVDKQQTEEQSGEDERESSKETLSVGPATSPSTTDKEKDSTSLEEVISVPMDQQQTEEQSGEDESESFKETLSVGSATSPSTIDKGKDSTSLEEVISVPMDKQQTEEQSGEDESESFKETLSVGSAAQEHDIKGRTITFEAMHKECIRVLPYENTSGQVYVQLYVFCDKNDIPKELEAAAQEFFEETGVELRWTNLYNYASNKPNIVSEDFKQLEVPQVNDISNIINRNLPVFSKHRNITAIQPSLKVTNSKQTNDPCIRVYVLGKRYLPVGESEIPNAVENYPVDIVNGFWLEASDTRKPLMAHKQGEYLRLGASIGVRGKNSAGTLGAIVKDDGGTFYLLSCDHVMRDEREGQIIHPGKCHYRNSLEYHLLGYHNWINRIFNQQDIFQDNHRDPAEYFRQLESKVDSFYSGKYRHPKLRECERKLRKLISEPPRTVAHFIDGIRENVGEERYIDVAVAKLTNEEIEALKRNGYVEIIDTTDYPDGNVTWDGSVSVREWRKSGSTSGYTSLKNRVLVDNVYLKHSASGNPSSMLGSSVYAERVMSDAVWCKKCMILSRIDDSFAGLGDSGTVIFEKSEPQPQAMPGFGIIIGFLFDKDDRCVETIAIPLGIALHHLSEKLRSRLTLVSAL